ncbi:class I SAM-dependent methyltransferase [Peptococcaceae bacterium]|nr:class I SAM-dependent methyltransferase [Peptococcaceae bacterium]
MLCPLCENEDIKIIEKIEQKYLVYLIQKLTGINFSYLINQDIDYCECKRCKLRFFYPMVTGDEKFYNSLQKFDWYYMDEKEEFKIALKYIDNNEKVLEIGSGKGAFAKYLNKNEYVGIDFSKKAKEMAKKEGILIENKTIEEFAQENFEKFDVVCSFHVLEHVSNPKSFIEASLKVLKKRGKMIIAVPNEDSFIKYAVNAIGNMPPHHVTRWKKDVFKFISQKYNLELMDIVCEKLQPYQKQSFISIFINHLIFGQEKLLVEKRSFTKKVIKRAITLAIQKLAKPFNFKDEFLPDGVAVVAIFRK